MKNFVKWLGIISMALVIGLSFSDCDDGSTGGGGGGFNGVWKASDGEEITLNNGSFVVSENIKQFLRGKYTTSAKSIATNITMAAKEIHGDILSEIDDTKTFENKWYDEKKVKEIYLSLSDAKIADLLEILFPTKIGTIDGDTMTIDGDTYTKQGGGGGGGGAGKWTAVDLTSIFGNTNGIYTVAYGNGTFVAGHASGKKATSPDGVNWTAVSDSKFGTTAILAIAYGNGTFVAGGRSSKMAYSSDGKTWTAVANSTFGDDPINAIAYGGDKFVAGSTNWSKMAYSTNGTSWTSISGGAGAQSITYGGGKFVTVGGATYSSNGTSWTAANVSNMSEVGSTWDPRAVAWGNGKFVAAGYDCKIAYSSDGATWTKVDNSTFRIPGGYIKAIAWGNGTFVAGDSHNGIVTSSDGIKWTVGAKEIFGNGSDDILAIAYGNGTFVAVGSNCKLAYSKE
jgi:hypothetical protein